MSNVDRVKLRKDNPETWIPVTPGDVLDGSLVEVNAAWSDVQYDGKDPQSGYYPLLRVEVTEAPGYAPGDVLAVHCFAAVLRDRIVTHEPIPGERLRITYEGEGEAKTKGRSAPQLYRVELPDRPPEVAAAKAYGQFTRRGGADAPAAQTELPAGTTGPGDDHPF